MNFYDTKFQELVREHLAATEKVIMDAFEKHFGFPIAQVEDKENLARIVQEGNPEDVYRYRGEAFLYMSHVRYIEYNKTSNCHEVKVSLSYKMV
jgi:hypothetical protein